MHRLSSAILRTTDRVPAARTKILLNSCLMSLVLAREVEEMRNTGLSRPAVATTRHSEFAASWGYQTVELIKRSAQRHWRDPTYLIAKLALNIIGG